MIHIFNGYGVLYGFSIRIKDYKDKMCSMYRTRDGPAINDKQNTLSGNYVTMRVAFTRSRSIGVNRAVAESNF